MGQVAGEIDDLWPTRVTSGPRFLCPEAKGVS